MQSKLIASFLFLSLSSFLPILHAADAVIEKPAEATAVAAKPDEATAQKSVETAVQKPVEAVAQKPAEAVTEKPAEAVTQTPAEPAVEKPVEPTAQTLALVAETAAKPVEAATKKSAEPIKQISAEVEIDAEKPVEAVTEKPVETATVKPSETITEKPAEPVLEKTPEAAAEKQAEAATQKSAELPAEENQKVYTVWRVYNADMLRLKEDEKLVLAGVDSPEYFLNGKQYKDASRAKIELKTMRWAGKQANKFVRGLTQGRKISVETLAEPRDSHKRLVGYAFLSDGTFVNAEMVRAGYARVANREGQDKYREQLLKLQDEARENNRGLWAYGIFQKLNA